MKCSIKVKKIFRQKNSIFFENFNLIPLECTIDYPMLKEESIGILRLSVQIAIGQLCRRTIFLPDGIYLLAINGLIIVISDQFSYLLNDNQFKKFL